MLGYNRHTGISFSAHTLFLSSVTIDLFTSYHTRLNNARTHEYSRLQASLAITFMPPLPPAAFIFAGECFFIHIAAITSFLHISAAINIADAIPLLATD